MGMRVAATARAAGPMVHAMGARSFARVVRALARVGVIALLILCRCDGPSGPGTGQDKYEGSICVVGRGPRDPLARMLVQEVDRFRQAFPRIRVELLQPKVETAQAQHDSLEGLATQRWNVVVVWVTEPFILRGDLDQISRQGAPVVLLGRDVPDSGRAVFCGVAERDAGAALADACAHVLPGGGTIGVLYGGKTDPAVAERWDGFRTAVEKKAGLSMLRAVDCSNRELESTGILATEIRKYPRMGGWVLLDAWPLQGLSADATPVPPEAALVFFSHGLDELARIKRGQSVAMVTVDAREMVRRGLSMALLRLRSAPMEARTFLLPPLIVTRATLDEFCLQQAIGTRSATSGQARQPAPSPSSQPSTRPATSKPR